MRKRVIYFFSLCLLNTFVIHFDQANANQDNWTEEKVGKFAVKADKAARYKKWRLAIKYGEKMLEGSMALYSPHDPSYIYHLKSLNKYYDKAGRLSEVSERIEQAYKLSNAYLNPTQSAAITCRTLYYKLVLSQKKYKEAIPVIHINIDSLTPSRKDQFRKLHYFRQLYALYALMEDFEKEEDYLLNYISLYQEIIGPLGKESETIVKRLAQNYCRRKLTDNFEQIIIKYDLKYICD